MINVMHINNPCTKVTLVEDTAQSVELESGNYISIYNSGSSICFVKSGVVGTVADTNDTFIPPGFCISYKRDNRDTHLSVISSEASDIYIQSGEGL